MPINYMLRRGRPKQIIIVDGAEHRLRQNDRAMAIVIDWLKSQLLQIDL